MKARTMFEKEDYKLIDNKKENYIDGVIVYRYISKAYSGNDGWYDFIEEIEFDIENKNINFYIGDNTLPLTIDTKILKAINKQVEELQWNK